MCKNNNFIMWLFSSFVVVGLELFFNLPRHPHPTQYVYHTARLKAHYHIVPDVTQTIQQILCDADFMGQMTKYLNNGWKLVDLCMDTAALNEGESGSPQCRGGGGS